MSDHQSAPENRLLDPISRISEVLFGLIMALTFTGTLSVATAGHQEVREMLVGAIGCNIAWGLVDAVMYVMTRLTEHGRALRAVRAVREAADPTAAHRVIADVIPPLLVSALPAGSIEAVRVKLCELPGLPARPRLTRADWLGAVAVFFLVVLSTFPVVIPFMVMERTALALRVSNGVAVAMLFACGFRLGQYAGHRPWGMGLGMAVIGSVLVALTIALGG